MPKRSKTLVPAQEVSSLSDPPTRSLNVNVNVEVHLIVYALARLVISIGLVLCMFSV